MDSIAVNTNFQLVEFNNAILVCPILNGIPYVVIKCITDAIGLSVKRVTRDLKNNHRLGSRVAEWQPAKSILGLSSKHSYACLPINKIAAFLYGISPRKVLEKSREALIIFQEKCDEVLFDFFFGGNRSHVKYSEKVSPLALEIQELEDRLDYARNSLKTVEEYKLVNELTAKIRTLKAKRRAIERSYLQPTLF